MGVFSVPIKVRNWQNRFLPTDKQGKEIQRQAVVDTGAVELALPAENINRLKLEQLDIVRVYADGGQHEYFLVPKLCFSFPNSVWECLHTTLRVAIWE